MRRANRKALFVYIIICFLFLELTLQATGFLLQLKIKKQNLNYGGDFNILCFGDSFTYGLGAPREDSYPRQLERILNNTYPQRHIKVINLGIPGYNSSQCLRYLKEKFDFYNPKIVLVMSGMNNCWSFAESSYFKIKQAKRSNLLNFRAKFIDALLCKLKTYKLIKIAFVNIAGRLRSSKSWHYQDSPLPGMEFKMPLRSAELIQLLNEGLRYFEEGKYDLSEVYYRRALELAPDDYEPHWFMGRFYIFKAQKEKAKEELILAAKYATHPYTVTCILADLQDRNQPKNSKEFNAYADLIKGLRSYWVEKFGEEYVRWFIDPIISHEENDLTEVLVYDLAEMANYASQKKARFVILTYPFPATKFRYPADIYNRISNYLNTPLVNNVFLFGNNLKIYRYEELFSTDGHCTSKGYRLIAENTSDVLKKYNLLLKD